MFDSRPQFEPQLTGNRWHILTGIGGYVGVAVVDLVTSGEVTNDPVDLFAWPVPFAAKVMTTYDLRSEKPREQ